MFAACTRGRDRLTCGAGEQPSAVRLCSGGKGRGVRGGGDCGGGGGDGKGRGFGMGPIAICAATMSAGMVAHPQTQGHPGLG